MFLPVLQQFFFFFKEDLLEVAPAVSLRGFFFVFSD